MPLKNQVILLLSFILASIPTSSSSYIDPYVLSTDWVNQTCATVPYPFGVAGIALPGFEIGCPKENPWSSSPLLSTSKNTYSISEISLQGYIKIFAGPIEHSCIGVDGQWTKFQGSGNFNLEGTSFTLSYQNNMLTIVGGNSLAMIRRKDNNLTSGCVTFCDPQGSFTSGSCSGLGSCQAALLVPLKSFNLQFTQVDIITNSSEGGSTNYSTAFFAQRDDFQSNKSGFLFQNFNFHDFQNLYNNHLLIQLDWAIGNKSCEDSKRDTGSFACKNHSYCYDSPSMARYLCNCSQGYKGNPYAEDGCTGVIPFF